MDFKDTDPRSQYQKNLRKENIRNRTHSLAATKYERPLAMERRNLLQQKIDGQASMHSDPGILREKTEQGSKPDVQAMHTLRKSNRSNSMSLKLNQGVNAKLSRGNMNMIKDHFQIHQNKLNTVMQQAPLKPDSNPLHLKVSTVSEQQNLKQKDPRHIYIPFKTNVLKNFDTKLFVDAAHILRGYKEHDTLSKGRNKSKHVAGRLIVRDENTKKLAIETIEKSLNETLKQMNESYKALIDPNSEATLKIRREIANLEHAKDNIITKDETQKPGILRQGKMYVSGHGSPGDKKISNNAYLGKDLTVIGGEVAEMANANNWEILDQRLISCYSGDQGKKGKAPSMSWLHQGAKMKQNSLPVMTYGYRGPYVMNSHFIQDNSLNKKREMHTKTEIGTVKKDGKHNDPNTLSKTEETNIMEVVKKAESEHREIYSKTYPGDSNHVGKLKISDLNIERNKNKINIYSRASQFRRVIFE